MSRKSQIRLFVFLFFFIVNYLWSIVFLFFTNNFVLSAIFLIILFLSEYFLTIDLYKYKKSVLKIFSWLFIIESIIFPIFLWFSVYLFLELLLFNLVIYLFYQSLSNNIKKTLEFSPYRYFVWWLLSTSILTIFFCILFIWKYTQIPFSCEDINNIQENVVESVVEPFKNSRKSIKSRFWFEEKKKQYIPEFYFMNNPLQISSELESAKNVESFFTSARNYILWDSLELKNEITIKTCESYVSVLKKLQQNKKIQIATIFLSYFILVWVFRILTWIVSIVWFILFIFFRLCRLYKYEKIQVEKEFIK